MKYINMGNVMMRSVKPILNELIPPFLNRLSKSLYLSFLGLRIDLRNRFSGKIFCIGFNKTGTTSVEYALRTFGYRLGNQAVGEMLLPDWYKEDYNRLIRFCHKYDTFQDIPFSCPGTYRFLDKAFPYAKFILTVRDSRDQWYQSLVKFHIKKFSSDKNRPPNENDLKNAMYRYKGYGLDYLKMVFNYPKVSLYDFDYYTNLYEKHNTDTIDYFKDHPDKLLVLNVSEPDAYQALASFLNIKVSDKSRFPWKNKT